jgi:benzoyl-CoA reductase/2-hydroxyglutaryl-CoA dehydratase subunit BcrC/BadD/HgdB
MQTALSENAAQAILFTTRCDQMRRLAESASRESGAPVFLMNLPKTWQTPSAGELYLSELRRLGRFLVGIGGSEPSAAELAATMRQYEARRQGLCAARGRLSAADYWRAMVTSQQDGECTVQLPARPRAPRGVRLALVGGPMMAHHGEVFDLIEGAGGSVVLDATVGGELTMPAAFDPATVSADPLRALADAYFGSIPDAFRRPNTALYNWLATQIAERGVQGLVFRHYTWCDTWAAEAQRMKEWAPVPVVVTTASADGQIDRHCASRIEALVEMFA